MRFPKRQSEPSPISSTIQAYHICTRTRAKAIATCVRSGDAKSMAKKIDDGTKLVKESVGRKSDTINEGRGHLSAVEGRRSTLEDNFQVDVVSSRQDTRVATQSFSNLSDGAVRNCNRLYWINNEHSEAMRI